CPTLLSEAQEDLLCQEICKKIKTKEFPDTLDAIQMAWNLKSISEDVKKKLNLSWMCCSIISTCQILIVLLYYFIIFRF
ncbi:MAG: hypothetical protein EZS28_010564, partial [Streblomastix strix]